MTRWMHWAALALCFASMNLAADEADWVVVVHGGAGGISRDDPQPHETEVRAALASALEAAGRVLEGRGSAIDAVQAAVVLLEDSPFFNAGRGAVFTSAGTIELDAAIMDGADLRGGAVSGVTRIKNPVKAARAVMDHSPHVLLYGEGAEAFARTQNLEFVDPSYFRTEERWQQLERARKAERALPPDALPDASADRKHGTVGAVALDVQGNLAAATSTGGLTNKRFGRIGDSPILGAGTYADNRSCAVSATGQGEYFIRLAAARTICARVELKGESVGRAARTVVEERLVELGGEGGVIVVDRRGRVAMVMNTPGMNRGSLRRGGKPKVKLFADE
jgi:L-asparaginase / beta-aspartyl-peptidase